MKYFLTILLLSLAGFAWGQENSVNLSDLPAAIFPAHPPMEFQRGPTEFDLVRVWAAAAWSERTQEIYSSWDTISSTWHMRVTVTPEFVLQCVTVTPVGHSLPHTDRYEACVVCTATECRGGEER